MMMKKKEKTSQSTFRARWSFKVDYYYLFPPHTRRANGNKNKLHRTFQKKRVMMIMMYTRICKLRH